ncbi:hypothetical protein ACEWY4_011385 [Coilia grayii]|uniref:Rhodanese domain-containing protein n=1 Tax=Coilia grayii TaxID=363190 RepID=A0ABD1K4M5_9TELE
MEPQKKEEDVSVWEHLHLIAQDKYLRKRIPKNPRYQHVKSRLDTGCSLTKQKERLEEMKKNYRYRTNELFKRLQVTTFAQLVLQVASVSSLNTANGEEEQDHACGQPETEEINFEVAPSRMLQSSPTQLTNDESGDSVFSPRSTLQSVISGVGELDLDRSDPSLVNPTPVPSPAALETCYPDCPYLLLDYLRKRIPKNPRYQHVKSRLDTGCSLTKQKERLEEMKKNYRYRTNELFKRLQVTTFAQLVLQVASVSSLNTANGEEEQDHACGQPETEEINFEVAPSRMLQSSPTQLTNDESGDSVFSPRSTLQSVISGVGELDLDRSDPSLVNPTPVPSPAALETCYPDCPYLLLDVRDRDLYDKCHITTAFSYPIATLSRTMNPFTKEILSYKNVIGKIIIVYDEDERLASQAATTMCERGFENLFMLSGGLKVLTQKFPDGMTTSFSPVSPDTPVSCLPAGTGERRSCLYQGLYEAEKKWRFSDEDLLKIQDYLDQCLMKGINSGRMKRGRK